MNSLFDPSHSELLHRVSRNKKRAWLCTHNEVARKRWDSMSAVQILNELLKVVNSVTSTDIYTILEKTFDTLRHSAG